MKNRIHILRVGSHVTLMLVAIVQLVWTFASYLGARASVLALRSTLPLSPSEYDKTYPMVLDSIEQRYFVFGWIAGLVFLAAVGLLIMDLRVARNGKTGANLNR